MSLCVFGSGTSGVLTSEHVITCGAIGTFAGSRQTILAAAARLAAPLQRSSRVKGVLPLQSVENQPRRYVCYSHLICSAGVLIEWHKLQYLALHAAKLLAGHAAPAGLLRQKRLLAGGSKPGCTAAARPAAQQMTLSLPESTCSTASNALGLAPPQRPRSGEQSEGAQQLPS